MIERYSLPQMKSIWELDNKFRKWLDIEIYACEAWAKLGKIPVDAVERIKEKANFTVERIEEIEAQTRHDVVAFTRNVAEYVGEDAKYIHYGLTSSDVVDTALAALMKQAGEIIVKNLEDFAVVLKRRASEHKHTIMMGRTHGIHAEPITFGLKMALWYTETLRNIERMKRAVETISVGKLSGAVGTYANIDPFIEAYVCEKMGLKPAEVATQVLQRDRHAEYMSTLAVIASSLDKFATEIRALQKTDTLEAEEKFYKGQKGSSAMPHKRNPVNCEQIAGLARVVRGNALASFENVALWHERDISHSSVERVVVPDSTILVNYMLNKLTNIVDNLIVYPENMKKNVDKTRGLIFSGRLLLFLIEKGMQREQAYDDVVQKNAMLAWEEGHDFRELIYKNEEVAKYLSKEELAECFNYDFYIRHVDSILSKLGIE